MDSATRSDMESRLGHDFARVRVHAGGRPQEAAQALQAQAFTSGWNIVFDAGRYAPSTSRGRQLLAHELTHVVQQQYRNDPAVPSIQRQPAAAAKQEAEPDPGPAEKKSAEAGSATKKPVAPVISMLIDSGSNEAAFITATGEVLRGSAITDLEPGAYTIRPDHGRRRWIINPLTSDHQFKVGQRFEIDLSPHGDPFSLSYAGELPLQITSGGLPWTPVSLHVDNFIEIIYNPDRGSVGGNLSKWFVAIYPDGGAAEFHLDQIKDREISPALAKAWLKDAQVGEGGRVFPRELNKTTTPRLWGVKQLVFRLMDEHLWEIVMLGLEAVYFVLTLVPGSAGGGWQRIAKSPGAPPRGGLAGKPKPSIGGAGKPKPSIGGASKPPQAPKAPSLSGQPPGLKPKPNLIVGRQPGGRQSPFLSKFPTQTMAPGGKSGPSHFTTSIQNAPAGLSGKFAEVFLERLPMMAKGLDGKAVSAAHRLLTQGGQLKILVAPTGTVQAAQQQLRTLVSSKLFRDISVTILKIGNPPRPHVLLRAFKL